MPDSVTFAPITLTAGSTPTKLPPESQGFLDAASAVAQADQASNQQIVTAVNQTLTSPDVPGAQPGSSAPTSGASIQPSTSPTNSQIDPSVLYAQYVQSPAKPIEYQGLSYDPAFSVQYEPNLAPQVEGSDALLRKLSPFTLRIELPLVYSSFTSFQTNSISVNTFGNAQQTVQGYDNARTTLARTGLGTMSGTAQSPPEYIAQNAASSQTRGTRTGGQAQDSRSSGKLGEPAIADFMTATDIARQLAAVLNAPPLTLLINPSSMRLSYTKLQNYTDRTRYGYLHHEWGDEQVKISITAKCGAFYSGGRGVSYASKRDSVAWQNLMNAFSFYKHNGYIVDTLGASYAHLFVGALSIHYDQWIYYGNMDQFSWSYNDKDQLGGVEFTMEFVANSIIDTAQPINVVAPMKSPTVNPGDPAYYGMSSQASNQPNVYSVGVDSNGQFQVTTQGRPATVSSLQNLIPGTVSSLIPQGSKTTPTGRGAFLLVPTVQFEGRPISLASPSSVKPFGV